MTDSSRLPKSTFSSKYPFCQTHVSRSGHEKHVDDTPGHERLREAHKAGTYWEVTEDGRRVTLVVKDDFQYVKGGLTLTIDNNEDILVAGNYKLVVKGDVYQEVDGDSYTVCKGDSTIATLGDSINMVNGDSYTKVKGSMHTSVNGNMNAEVKGNAEISVNGSTSIVSGGSIDMEGETIRINSKGGPLTLKGSPVNIVQG